MVTYGDKRIDMHMHVGVIGDEEWAKPFGKMSQKYRSDPKYKVFLLFAGLSEQQANDAGLMNASIDRIRSCTLDYVVCLALDPVYERETGQRQESRSEIWVDNSFILHLRDKAGNNTHGQPKVLLGCSVHPFASDFKARVDAYVQDGAVLIKWLPSAQQFKMDDPKVLDAMKYLATAKQGRPLPILLHTAYEYAIPTTDERSTSFDFLSWKWYEWMWNRTRGKERWHDPDVRAIRNNLKAALGAGCVIIFAHCGLPYFATNSFLRTFEHDDSSVVRDFLEANPPSPIPAGCAYADVSAFCTPTRKTFFGDIAAWPNQYLLYGSDFPTPAFELSADVKEMLEDFKAMLKGHPERIVVPEDNLLDVNFRELSQYFGAAHPMFTNFGKLLDSLK